MSRLSSAIEAAVIAAFEDSGSISKAASLNRVARNTAKRILRDAEILPTACAINASAEVMGPCPAPFKPLFEPDLLMLQGMLDRFPVGPQPFKQSNTPLPETTQISFKENVIERTKVIAAHLGVDNELDALKLQVVMSEFVSHLILSYQSLASTADYLQFKDLAKMARRTRSLGSIASEHYRNFMNGIRDLEITYRRRLPDMGRGNSFINIHGPSVEA
ncbi:hypothetical protein WDW86_00480 [Bdellovibrionota bacterium FG-2]